MARQLEYRTALTRKECCLLKQMAHGWEAIEIAAVETKSKRSVESQRSEIYRKMGVTKAIEAVMLALKNNLIHLDEIDITMFKCRRSTLTKTQRRLWVSYVPSIRGWL